MHRVQRRRRRAGHPGGVGAGHRVADLLRHHVGHPVGRRPHALADLRAARQATAKADADIPVLISGNPGAGLHLRLGDHRAAGHGGVDFVSCAIEKAGVDEHDAPLHRRDARGEIGGGAPLLIHHPHFQRVACKAQQILHRIEQAVGEAAFVRPMHLGLHDIDAARAAVAEAAKAFEVVQRNRAGQDRVQYPLGRFATAGQMHGWRRHQMADIAHEQQGATGQRDVAIGAVGVQPARHRRAALVEGFLQIALHQPQPIGIGGHLVLCIDGGDRVLQVDNRGQRRFEQHIGNAGGIVAANGMRAVDHQLDMQAVVAQQQRLPCPRHQLPRIGQLRIATGEIGPAALG